MTDDFAIKEPFLIPPHAAPRLNISEGTRNTIRSLIRDKWPSGRSVKEMAKEISAELDLPISKNMVSGLAHRMKLDKRESPIKPKQPWTPEKIRKQKFNPTPTKIKNPKNATIRQIWFSGAREEKPEPKPKAARRPALNPIPMEALRSNSCRWPEWGDERPTFMYCGEKTPEHSSYCSYHRSFAFKPRFTQEGKTDNGTDSQATADGAFGETNRMVRQEPARVPSHEASSGASEVGTGE